MNMTKIAGMAVAALLLAVGAANAGIVYQTGFEPTTYSSRIQRG